jgi:hypothetical protein
MYVCMYERMYLHTGTRMPVCEFIRMRARRYQLYFIQFCDINMSSNHISESYQNRLKPALKLKFKETQIL